MTSGLEDLLRRDFPAFTPLFTYRGTAALYLAFRAIAARRGEGEIVIPATICPDVPLAVRFAGFTPRFCEVDLATFSMTPDTVMAAIGPETKAIVAVHLFGKALAMPEMLRLARERGIPLVEDLAQAVGGECRGQKLGSFGDFSILSFDDKKILPGSGGLLLTRDAQDAEAAVAAQAALPEALTRDEAGRLGVQFNDFSRELSARLRKAGLSHADPDGIWRRAQAEPRLFLARPRPEDRENPALLAAYRDLARQRTERHRRYLEYAKRLSAVPPVRFTPDEMCWRLPLLAGSPERRDFLVTRIRELGALASDHYFPASFAFGDPSARAAREIGLRALNLWVDDRTDENLIPAVCAEINRAW